MHTTRIPSPPMTLSATATRRASRAFTLIELLTVIAIIGILAAIIIPTVGKVRASAKSTQCLSNLRQIALAISLYPQDNKGYYPRGGSNPSPDGTLVNYAKAVYPYIPNRGNTATGVITNKVFVCPSEALQPEASTPGSVVQYTATFALEAGSAASVATGLSGNGPRQVSSIINPSRTYLLLDGVPRSTSDLSCDSSCTHNAALTDLQATPTTAVKISFRHNENINAAFVDGHTAKVSFATLKAELSSVTPNGKDRWNGKVN